MRSADAHRHAYRARLPARASGGSPRTSPRRSGSAIAFAWCMVLFAMMPLWHWKGGQNPSGIRARTTPQAFSARVGEFITQYQTGEDRGHADRDARRQGPTSISPPSRFSGSRSCRLQKNAEYTLHLSSLDVNHGFSLYPINVNFQVVPGYDYGLRVTPNASGDFRIICNEFCGIGHHVMVGRVIVDDAPVADSRVRRCAMTTASRARRRPARQARQARSSAPARSTGRRIDLGAERLIKVHAVASVVSLLIGAIAAVLLVLTRWQAVHLLPAVWFYRILGVHGMSMLIFFIIFFEMAVLFFASTVLLNARNCAPKIVLGRLRADARRRAAWSRR